MAAENHTLTHIVQYIQHGMQQVSSPNSKYMYQRIQTWNLVYALQKS
jgi:hypothetical protein